ARLMDSAPGNGQMFSTTAPIEVIQHFLKGYDNQASIAGLNAPGSIAVAGEFSVIEELKKSLVEQGYKTKSLKVSHAFHSPLMDSILPEFEKIADQFSYKTPTIPIISNLTGQMINDQKTFSGSYWKRHL